MSEHRESLYLDPDAGGAAFGNDDREPQIHPDFIHSQKRHPVTGLRDTTVQWDFRSPSPESLHQVAWLFGDRGLPATLRYMDGFGSHTVGLWNNDGARFRVKWHLRRNGESSA
ncbi:MAG: catalase [Pseudomonadota bacterium]|nr:catalase [Pseudomonadota bacterium]